GVRLRGVATSIESSERARAVGVNVEEDYAGTIDLDVDGADEMDGSGNLVKGGGGALLREKIVAYNSRNVCIIADESKLKENGLGTFRIPVEVLPYLSQMTRNQVEKIGGICIFRENGKYRTDNGNMVMDCDFGIIKNPPEMERKIKMIPGVIEVGLFSGLVTMAIIAGQSGVRTVNFKNLSP
ncbi:MAG: ribose 5-phosphate isomerase A, partial [Candidatus Thermoplasmatota archaeon]|nr:ribose 5-phosphate isomerase A [Candidatus Thermoplasmatota archaeon]